MVSLTNLTKERIDLICLILLMAGSRTPAFTPDLSWENIRFIFIFFGIGQFRFGTWLSRTSPLCKSSPHKMKYGKKSSPHKKLYGTFSVASPPPIKKTNEFPLQNWTHGYRQLSIMNRDRKLDQKSAGTNTIALISFYSLSKAKVYQYVSSEIFLCHFAPRDDIHREIVWFIAR